MALAQHVDQAVLHRLASRPGLLDQSNALALQMAQRRLGAVEPARVDGLAARLAQQVGRRDLGLDGGHRVVDLGKTGARLGRGLYCHVGLSGFEGGIAAGGIEQDVAGDGHELQAERFQGAVLKPPAAGVA